MNADVWFWVMLVFFATCLVLMILGKMKIWHYCVLAIPMYLIECLFVHKVENWAFSAFFIVIVALIGIWDLRRHMKKTVKQNNDENKPPDKC